jgi:hypothetical protein
MTQAYTGHLLRDRNPRAYDVKNVVLVREENQLARSECQAEMTVKNYVLLDITPYSLVNVCIA